MSKTNSLNERRQKYIDILLCLHQTFPDCFINISDPKLRHTYKPVKVGIHRDLFEWQAQQNSLTLACSKKQIREAMKYYTHTPGYMKAIIQGLPRVNLQGNPVENVTAEQIALAQEFLNRLQIKRKQQYRAKSQQQKKIRAADKAAEPVAKPTALA
jgi:ProP effector